MKDVNMILYLFELVRDCTDDEWVCNKRVLRKIINNIIALKKQKRVGKK